MKKHLSKIIFALIVVAFTIACAINAPIGEAVGSLWSLLPPVVAIGLALITKEVYSSLFIGILAGGVIYGAAFYKAKDNKLYYLRAVICCFLQFIISITLMSGILTDIGYFSSFSAAVVIRMPAALVTLFLHLLVTAGGKKIIFRLKKLIFGEELQ